MFERTLKTRSGAKLGSRDRGAELRSVVEIEFDCSKVTLAKAVVGWVIEQHAGADQHKDV